ncbi:membrane protein [Steroidobacter agaridevorans]|uniref:Membrane protein n=1 Tax=Steroidobacter agaridevorans TaxID=2695856 RepID=A0A829YGQ5_9GAMM|nr:TonB-dependent receptor [Steroidobacter agaridevorans]GFE82093.1 membrane protein [Steroidobacter agaridevorans]
MLRRFLPFAALIYVSASLPAHAQEGAAGAVRGRIVDSVTGRAVPTATVHLMRNQRVHSTVEADVAGAFSFNDVPEGVYSVEVEEQGYLKAVQADVRVVLRRVAAVEFALVRGSDDLLAEVVVSARATAGDPRATPNTVLLEREEIRRNPGSAGDVFRALDVLPGVVATGEFSNFTVRGNGPRDNLILIDGIPFDKVAHFDQSLGEQEDIEGGGRYSIFAPNIVGSAKFSPGGWRASEGGKNGSLLELEIAEGNPASSTVGARVDIIGIEADYEGPSYVADNTSLLLSARQFDFSNLFEAIDENDIGTPRLTDFIMKSVTDLNDEHRLELLAIYAGEDFTRTVENALESEDFEDVALGESEQDSTLFGVTWRWSPGEVAQLRNTLYYRNSDKTSTQGEAFPDLAGPDPTPETTPVREDILRIEEGETEIGWRGDFSTMLGPDGIFSAGAQVARVDLDFDRRLSGDWTRYVFDQSDYRADPTQQYIVLTPAEYNSTMSAAETRIAAYTDYAWTVGDFTWTPGMRYERDGFSGKSVVAPRLSLTWQLDAVTRVWTGGGVYYQAPRYIDIAANPSNLDLESERSTQVVLGFSRHLREDLRFSAEGYYQQLDDLIVFDDRTTDAASNTGEGSATGVDLMLAKRMSRGWSASATYSYSRARRDDNLGEGELASDWDRPHAFGIVGVWQPSDRWTFSAKWKYASGRPTDAFVVHSDVLGDAGPLRYSKELTRTNAERLPAYHSLSLRADYQRRFGPLSLVAYLDVLNVYGRENGNAYEWDERRGANIIEGLDEMLPTIGLRFEYSWTPGQ